jgi:hypothetical protein
MNLHWTRDGIGNYVPLITRVGSTYYRVHRGNGAWIVEASNDRKEWTLVSKHSRQRDSKAWVAALA